MGPVTRRVSTALLIALVAVWLGGCYTMIKRPPAAEATDDSGDESSIAYPYEPFPPILYPPPPVPPRARGHDQPPAEPPPSRTIDTKQPVKRDAEAEQSKEIKKKSPTEEGTSPSSSPKSGDRKEKKGSS
jgi:type IV secretory pathway VirB10-like protein